MANDSLYVPDSLDLSALEIIANSCVDAYGGVINEARNILMGLQKQVIEFADNCNLQSANRAVNVNYQKNSSAINQIYYPFNLYPNPNNGKFTLESINTKDVKGNIFVTDILGNTIIETPFVNKAEININDRNSKGMYFIKVINEENKTIYIGKTIVH